MLNLKRTLLIGLCLYAMLFLSAGFAADSKSSAPNLSKNELPAPTKPVHWQVETGTEPEVSIPHPRISAPLTSQSVSPYILMHTGCRETDNDGSWKRHAVNIPGGNVQVLYGVGDSNPITNNRYKYNCYNPTTGLMTFAPGAEPQATPPQSDQNGGIDVTPSGRAVWVGRRGIGAGTVVSFDSSSCAGLITSHTFSYDPRLPLDPAIYVVNETTWVAFLSNLNGIDIGSSCTTDGGET